jgi:hypothetical protein
MLEANPGRWLLETSSASLVSTPTRLPDGATVPSLTSAYDSLAANAGDAGVSDDLAVALEVGDAGTRNEWLARGRTVIAASSLGQDAPLTAGALEAIGPVVTAGGYAQTCEASAPPPPPPPQGTSGGGAPSSQGTSSGAAVDLGAGGATAIADSTGGCGGDSSDSSGDSCGGDTSSSSDGTDSSSSDSSSGCSGSTTDSSSSDSGSGCSGSSDSSSSSSCSVYDGAGPRRPRRSGTSRFLLLLVGVAALCRRFRRAG